MSSKRIVVICFVFACLFGWSDGAHADVRLPGFFGDNMVLQQGMKIPVWGWADPGENVVVGLTGKDGGNAVSAKANEDGKWRVELPAMKATKTPLTLEVRGRNEIKHGNILIGEVWLCSGQSNMEWSVRQSANPDAEIAAGDYPLIRHVKIPRRPSATPLDDTQAQWQVCSPETVADFTAVGYYMARELLGELDVPIGLVNSSWGGTRVEPWTPPVGFQGVPEVKGIYQSVLGRTPGSIEYRTALKQHIKNLDAWVADAKTKAEGSDAVPASPAFPDSLKPFTSHQDPTMLYNGMLHALVGFPIRGAIWYQGESNSEEGMAYFDKKKALIQGWRELWGQGDFPFYFVQIAPYRYGRQNVTLLADFWEAQEAVEQIDNTGMVVINDIATVGDIHPPNKQDVGRRLAGLALRNDYGRDSLVAESPKMKSVEQIDGKLKVNFARTAGGLKTRDGKAPSLFEVIGADSDGFQAATAEIKGDSVILSSPKVKTPVAFRFAWNELAEPNLMGGTGLPVGACRGGKAP